MTATQSAAPATVPAIATRTKARVIYAIDAARAGEPQAEERGALDELDDVLSRQHVLDDVLSRQHVLDDVLSRQHVLEAMLFAAMLVIEDTPELSAMPGNRTVNARINDAIRLVTQACDAFASARRKLDRALVANHRGRLIIGAVEGEHCDALALIGGAIAILDGLECDMWDGHRTKAIFLLEAARAHAEDSLETLSRHRDVAAELEAGV